MRQFVVAALAVAFLNTAASQTPEADFKWPAGVHATQKDVAACAKAKHPCTVWTIEELTKLHNSAYELGQRHGKAQLLKELQEEFKRESEKANNKSTLMPRTL